MFGDLVSLIPAGDLLVLNSTRVRHARLLGTRPSGGEAEVLLIHPGADDTWIAMGRPGSAMRPGKRITLGPDVFVETVEVLDDGNRVVRFVGASAEEAIKRYGQLPLAAVHHACAGRRSTRSATRRCTRGGKDRSRHRRRGCTLPVRCWTSSRAAGCADRGPRPGGGSGNVQAGGVGRPARSRDARRAVRGAGGAGARGGGDASAWRRRVGRGDDGGARARERGRRAWRAARRGPPRRRCS